MPRAAAVRPRRPDRRNVGDVPGIGRLSTDDALIGVFIAAMLANGHVAPAESIRAHHLVWSTNRFRHREPADVGRHIERMRVLAGEHGADALVAAAGRALPARLRAPAFALAADLLLADGRIDRRERRFLEQAADRLGLDVEVREQILAVVLTKNRA